MARCGAMEKCTKHSAPTERRTGIGERDTDVVDQLAETVRLTWVVRSFIPATPKRRRR